MRKLLVALLTLAASATALPAPAHAASGFCSETGDYCYSAGPVRGVVRLKLATFSFRGSVDVCVTTPKGAKTCRPFRLRTQPRGVFDIDARWSAHFPNAGKGTYRVTFSAREGGGVPFKPSVTFRR